MRGALYSMVTNEGQAGDLEAGPRNWDGNIGRYGQSNIYRLVIQPFDIVYELNINKNGNGSGNSTAQVLYGHCVHQKK
jgi:hypothetical protein